MRILITLIKRELVENLTSSRYILTSILCVALCLTSIVLMSHDYETRLKRFNLRNNVHGLSAFGVEGEDTSPVIARPPQPLSVIARGVDEVIGRTARVNQWQPGDEPVAEFFNYYSEVHHLFDLFTTPDFVYIVSIVLSVFAIFLSFDAVSGEKETHNLSLLLSNSIPRSTLLLAKWIGGYTSFLISLCPALLLMFIFLTMFSGLPLQTEHWMPLLGIIGLSFIYLSVFYTLGLFISTLTHRSATALIFVLFIWAIWALGVPKVGILLSKTIKPVQPAFVFELAKREAREGRSLSQNEVREDMWKMDDAYVAIVDKQVQMGQHLSRFSPLASYLYASTVLAQTGPSDMKDYRQQLSQWFREQTCMDWKFYWHGEYVPFVYRLLTFGQGLSELFIDVILLLLWNLLLFMGANMVFLRYDVR